MHRSSRRLRGYSGPGGSISASRLVRSAFVSLGLLALAHGTGRAQEAAPGPIGPPPGPSVEYEGAIATGLALRRLGQTARLLHIGAHPDDENTALFSPLALGRGMDVAYLSLTRGEGGQNGIGPELGVPLGVIRTEELLAARRVDGATQFFTRAVDFGFSKTAAETFTHWPRDSVLADVVAVFRRFRPDVVVSVWTGTRRDGHGHHEASGLLSLEAVVAAGDPERFPEQIAAGLRPHVVERTYWSARYDEGEPDVELDTGALDPLIGRSYHQVAMASRSRHRSQDMGVPEAPGPRRTAFVRIDPANPPPVTTGGPGPGRQLEGPPSRSGSLFAGLDTLASQRAADAGLSDAAELLAGYEEVVVRARAAYDPEDPWTVLSELLRAHELLARAGRVVDDGSPSGLAFHLAAEARDLRRAILRTANVQLDAIGDVETVVPHGELELELSAWNGGPAPIRVDMVPALPDDWDSVLLGDAGPSVSVAPGRRAVVRYRVRVPADAEISMPYYLDPDAPEPSALYASPTDYSLRGLPFARPPVAGAFTVRVGPVGRGVDAEARSTTAELRLERNAQFVGVDPRMGEFRRPIRVVPRVTVAVEPELVVRRASADGSFPFRAILRSGAPDGARGTVRPVVPEGWIVRPEEIAIELPGGGASRTVSFDVTPPDGVAPGAYSVGATFRRAPCDPVGPCTTVELHAHGYETIDYPHIDPHHVFRRAVAAVRVLDVAVADVRVGYVAGVADGVPDALEQLGVAWETLDEDDLAEGDLSRFDVVIAGTRAYEMRPDLEANNHRLIAWARDGGVLVSFYNKYPALAGSYAPWEVEIDRPHGRVTDEAAPVRVLEPDHPLFRSPNPIGPEDWEGWVQERGLYFWSSWEGPLRPLLEMSDPGEPPLDGALLVGPLGEGTYVYSALALFRQLPAGVPGAWRLFANLVSLGAR